MKKTKSKDAIITVLVDESCEMADVSDNFGNGMSGNFWDFHPGCHGITKFGDFRGYNMFAEIIKAYHIGKGRKAKIVKKKYKYE